jgi:glycine cleavage system transcriptional repressor
MRTNLLFTLTGTDRIGIVEEVTQSLLDLGSNVEASRMARLGGEFAMFLLISLPSEQLAGLDKAVAKLIAEGFKVTTSPAKPAPTATLPQQEWRPYQIQVHGADHEGIIHQIARYLAERGINIESMDTGTARAPISGTPLFSMTARVGVPPSLSGRNWEAELVEVGQHLNVDVQVSIAERE